MEGEDPSPSGVKTQWGDPGDLDTASVFTTSEHLDRLIELFTGEWRKTMMTYTNASKCSAEILEPSFDYMEDLDPFEDTLTKVHVGRTPQVAIDKVNDLGEMDRNGDPRLVELTKLAKGDLAENRFPDSIASEKVEGGKSKVDILIGLLIELAKQRMFVEMSLKKKTKTGFQIPVVFMDQSGEMQFRSCWLQDDTDFASFLEMVEVYPKEYNENAEFATSSWDKRVQKLKAMGYGGNPKLGEIERRIASFKATDYSAVPKWVFYKTNKHISYAKPIAGNGDIKMILEILANPLKANQTDSMVRVCRAADMEIILITDELFSFERGIQDNVQPGNEPVAQPPQDEQGNQERLAILPGPIKTTKPQV